MLGVSVYELPPDGYAVYHFHPRVRVPERVNRRCDTAGAAAKVALAMLLLFG
jgi:hypothetical protein